jgi:hypothetical protein
MRTRPRTVIGPPYVVPVHDGSVKATEKGATTSVGVVVFEGIEIESRYNKAHELQEMLNAVRALVPVDRRLIRRVFCDSNATSCYSVYMTRDATLRDAMLIVVFLADYWLAYDDWHNGVYVHDANDRIVLCVDPGEVLPSLSA